jgi:hypothetical protein
VDTHDLDARAAAAARAVVLPDVLLAADVAAALGIADRTALGLLRNRLIPGRKLAGRWVVEREVFLHAVRPEFRNCADCNRLVSVADEFDAPMCAECRRRLRQARGRRP